MIMTNLFLLFFNVHQLKRDYALNLNILVSAVQKQKLTRIPLVTASEVGNTNRDKNKNIIFLFLLFKPNDKIHILCFSFVLNKGGIVAWHYFIYILYIYILYIIYIKIYFYILQYSTLKVYLRG